MVFVVAVLHYAQYLRLKMNNLIERAESLSRALCNLCMDDDSIEVLDKLIEALKPVEDAEVKKAVNAFINPFCQRCTEQDIGALLSRLAREKADLQTKVEEDEDYKAAHLKIAELEKELGAEITISNKRWERIEELTNYQKLHNAQLADLANTVESQQATITSLRNIEKIKGYLDLSIENTELQATITELESELRRCKTVLHDYIDNEYKEEGE